MQILAVDFDVGRAVEVDGQRGLLGFFLVQHFFNVFAAVACIYPKGKSKNTLATQEHIYNKTNNDMTCKPGDAETRSTSKVETKPKSQKPPVKAEW